MSPVEPTDEFILDDSVNQDATYTNPDGEITQIKVIFDLEYQEVDVGASVVPKYAPTAWARTTDVSDAVDATGATLAVGGVTYNIVTADEQKGVTVLTLSEE